MAPKALSIYTSQVVNRNGCVSQTLFSSFLTVWRVWALNTPAVVWNAFFNSPTTTKVTFLYVVLDSLHNYL